MTQGTGVVAVSRLGTGGAAAWLRWWRSRPNVAGGIGGDSAVNRGPAGADATFWGPFAHELNALLTVIVGRTELLIAHVPRADPIGDDAREVHIAALKAAGLMKQLVAWNCSGQMAPQAVDVNAAATHAIRMLADTFGADIAVTVRLGADIPCVRAGAGHVEEIVLSLVTNARDAMHTGGHLTVSTMMHTKNADAAGGSRCDYVRLIVADTDDRENQAARTATCAAALGKVYDIVHQLGGSVDIFSRRGVGTTFTLDLPVTPGTSFAPQALRDEVRGAPILVVDDDPDVRSFTKLLLTRDGHDVVAVAGFREALEALHRQPDISLLFIDVVMPEMNGYDLAREARTIVPSARVVFMSGFAADPARASGSDRFLAKPFTVETLTALVHEVLENA